MRAGGGALGGGGGHQAADGRGALSGPRVVEGAVEAAEWPFRYRVILLELRKGVGELRA